MQKEQSDQKSGVLHDDRTIIKGIFGFYFLCICGVLGLIGWWFAQRQMTANANTTATAAVIFTQNANSTGTAVARATELASYELIDTFKSNANDWRTGSEDTSYWNGSVQISSGVYSWDVQDAKGGFVAWAFAPVESKVKNFDTYVDIKFEEVAAGKACGGFLFHVSPDGWEAGGYTFYVCHSRSYSIFYHEGAEWQEIESQSYSKTVLPSDWNRLEVLVRDSHFVFIINNQIVFETADDRQVSGRLALFINVDEAGTKISFDNFGYQTR